MLTLRPSAAHRWTKCAKSVSAEASLPPQPESDEAREGTCAAWVADAVLRGDMPDAVSMIGTSHVNGWMVTVDMAHHCQKYVDLVRADNGTIYAEAQVRLSNNPLIQGTLDSATLDARGHLRVRDLKFGMVLVEVWENPQLLIYAGAMMDYLRSYGFAVNHVTLGIYQPRAFHHLGINREWSMSPDELGARCQGIVELGARCMMPEPPATPGKHCTYCAAKLGCEAFVGSTYRAAMWWHDSIHHRHMTGAELSEYWRFLDEAATMLKAAKSAADAEILARMKAGESVEGMFMKPRTGNRAWTVPADVVQALTGIDPRNGAMVSPAEMERRGVHPDMVNAMSKAPALEPKLDRMPPGYVTRMMGDAPK